MTTTKAIPIAHNWTSDQPAMAQATAVQVNSMLAQIEVADLGSDLVPDLAAAAVELATAAGIPCRFSTDDAPVALLRLIAKVAITQPHVGGPHTARLLVHLQQLDLRFG